MKQLDGRIGSPMQPRRYRIFSSNGFASSFNVTFRYDEVNAVFALGPLDFTPVELDETAGGRCRSQRFQGLRSSFRCLQAGS